MKPLTKNEIGHLEQQIRDHTGPTTIKIFQKMMHEREAMDLERKRLRAAIISMARFGIETQRIADLVFKME